MATMDATRAVRAATQAHLPSPDLGLNFEACDAVRDASDIDVIAALNEISARLNPAYGQNAPRQPTLALSLTENCVDNCGPRFIELAKDTRVSALVSRLDELHSLDMGEGIPGVILRKLGLEIGGARASTGAGGAGMSSSASAMPTQDAAIVLSKLRSEMDVVEERIKCDRGTSTDEIHDRNEFFEQCLPRLEKLIEFGASGGLPDDIVEKCLTLNDAALEALKADDALVDLLSDITGASTIAGATANDGAGAGADDAGAGAADGAGAGADGAGAGAGADMQQQQHDQPMLMPVPLLAPVSAHARSEVISGSSPASTPVDMYSSGAKLPSSDHTIDAVGSSMATPSPQPPPMGSGYGIQSSAGSGFTHVQPLAVATLEAGAAKAGSVGEGGVSMAKEPITSSSSSSSTNPNELFSSFDPFAPKQ